MRKRIASLALALAMCLGLTVPAAAEAYTSSANIGHDSNNRSVMCYLYANEKGGLTRVERNEWDMTMLIEEYNSSYQRVSRRSLPNGTTFSGFYAGKDYNFLCFNSSNTNEDDNTEVFRVDKYSKDWQLLGSGSVRGANTVTMYGNNVQLAEKNGMLFVHTAHTMYKAADGKRHQANFSAAFRISDMALIDSFHGVGGPAYVSHSLEGWQVLADQEDNLVMFEVGDGYPRAPVFHRLKGYAASASVSGNAERVLLFDIPGAKGDNTTGVVASGLAETSNNYVLAYRANRGLPNAIIPGGPADNYLAFVSKNGLSVKTVRLESPEETTFPRLVPTGLNGGYAMWRSSQNNSEGTVYLASYSDGAVTSTQSLGKGALSDCPPVLYNGRLVWYVTRYSEPVFYGADTTGIHTLSASTTAPGTLGGPAAAPAQPVQPAQPAAAGGFTDVAASSPYKDAIAWAVEQGITNGTGPSTFSPGNTCTVRQILTFLYRANGRPYASSSLSDLDAAEAWAISQGISRDNPSAPCTRAAAVTYLWKAAGSPAPSRTASFADVSPSAEYAQAVSWAVEKGITNGVGGDTFSPGGTCTRGQIVTFLYRAGQ